MGQFTSGSRRKSHRRSLHRFARRQNAFEIIGSSLRRTLGINANKFLVYASSLNLCCFIAAAPNQRQNAYPLPGECRQGPAVPSRSTCPFGKHGLARYRGRQFPFDPWSYLDHHSAFPGIVKWFRNSNFVFKNVFFFRFKTLRSKRRTTTRRVLPRMRSCCGVK